MTNPTPLPVPAPDPQTTAERRRELRKHKAFATGLLLLAAAVYVLCRVAEHSGTAGVWTGYVQAAAEAGMVGALADWFAVTALFRHPLGIPIPHTAIIKRKKDQVGHSLSEFVGENFLNAPLISEKLRSAQLPARAANWVVGDGGAERVSQEVGRLLELAVDGVDDAEAAGVLHALVVDLLRQPEWGPQLGRLLEQLIQEGRTEPFVDAVVVWLDEKARGSEDFIVTLIDERMPRWAPKFVRELAGERVYRECVEFTNDVRHDPHHEAREQFRRFIRDLAQDLQHDPVMVQRVEKLKEEMLGSEGLAKVSEVAWQSGRTALHRQAKDPGSLLRRRVTAWVRDYALRVQRDTELQGQLETRLVSAASYVADNYADDIASIIGDTVERWDAEEASDRIELMVGKDLQFIRVNGTVVGAAAGLAIYTLTQVALGLW